MPDSLDAGLDERCSRWLLDLSILLNLPDQDLIEQARDSVVREESFSLPSPVQGNPFEGSAAQQDAMLLALTAGPAKIAAVEKIRSRECQL